VWYTCISLRVIHGMRFGGHYSFEHLDLRPDVISTKDIVHAPLYGWIIHTRTTFLGVKTKRMLISYEVLAQLCTPDIMRIDRKPEVACASIISAVGRLPTVNYSRYLPLAGHNLLQNTAIVACGKFMDMVTQVRKQDFGLPLAASQ